MWNTCLMCFNMHMWIPSLIGRLLFCREFNVIWCNCPLQSALAIWMHMLTLEGKHLLKDIKMKAILPRVNGYSSITISAALPCYKYNLIKWKSQGNFHDIKIAFFTLLTHFPGHVLQLFDKVCRNSCLFVSLHPTVVLHGSRIKCWRVCTMLQNVGH